MFMITWMECNVQLWNNGDESLEWESNFFESHLKTVIAYKLVRLCRQRDLGKVAEIEVFEVKEEDRW